MKMWLGNFSKKDCDIINMCVIGATLRDGDFIMEDAEKSNNMESTVSRVTLPDLDIDDDIAYACHTNAEKTAIHAST